MMLLSMMNEAYHELFINKVSNSLKYSRSSFILIRLWLSILGTQRAFSDKVAPDIDGFTDELVRPCDAQLVENTFTDNSK